jgi:hypothetical protein
MNLNKNINTKLLLINFKTKKFVEFLLLQQHHFCYKNNKKFLNF